MTGFWLAPPPLVCVFLACPRLGCGFLALICVLIGFLGRLAPTHPQCVAVGRRTEMAPRSARYDSAGGSWTERPLSCEALSLGARDAHPPHGFAERPMARTIDRSADSLSAG